jgi:hypothetical protein
MILKEKLENFFPVVWCSAWVEFVLGLCLSFFYLLDVDIFQFAGT